MRTSDDSKPRNVADIPGWILRQVTSVENGRDLVDRLGEALNDAGLRILRVGISGATLNTAHRGITFNWRRGRGTQLIRMVHGAEGDAEFALSPLSALLSENRDTGRWRVDLGEGCNRFPMLEELRREGGTEYVLTMKSFPPDTALRGVGLSYATDKPGGFTDDDLAVLDAHRDALAVAVLRLGLSRSLRNILEAYLGKSTATRVILGDVRRGEGRLMPAAILLVDLKSFTTAADREDPMRLVGWLDEHLDALGQSVDQHGGEILKFTGDGFLAVFPVVEADALPCSVCENALSAARAGLAQNRALVERRGAAGEPGLVADLALHYGDVVYGNIGTASRLDFTAIGRAVNEASRIETLCDTTERNLLVSDSFARRCQTDLIDLGTFPLRGVATPQRVWTVAEG